MEVRQDSRTEHRLAPYIARLLTRAIVGAALLAGGLAQAEVVTVSMQFLRFGGVVGSGVQFSNFFDQGSGAGEVCPNAGCRVPGSDSATGGLTMALDRTDRFEFWNTDFGVERAHNLLAFTSSGPQDVSRGQEFRLGTLTYTNGIWFTDPVFDVRFVASNGFFWDDTIHLSITPNSTQNTPEQNADFIYLTNLTTLGSIRAYELGDSPTGSNTVNVSVYGMINSLDLTRFADAVGGGFLDPGIATEPTPRNVPEPAPVALLALGLAALGAVRRRAREVRDATSGRSAFGGARCGGVRLPGHVPCAVAC